MQIIRVAVQSTVTKMELSHVTDSNINNNTANTAGGIYNNKVFLL